MCIYNDCARNDLLTEDACGGYESARKNREKARQNAEKEAT